MVQRILDGPGMATDATPGATVEPMTALREFDAPAPFAPSFVPTPPAPIEMSLNANRDVLPGVVPSLRPAPVADNVVARAPDLLSVAFDWRKWWPWLALLLLLVLVYKHNEKGGR